MMINLNKYLLCALGHPISFFIYFFLLSKQEKIFSIPLFFKTRANLSKINIKLYIIYAILIYSLWVGFQFFLLHEWQQLSLSQFFQLKFTLGYTIVCSFGLINICIWSFGMNGYLFGLIFGLPFVVQMITVLIFELKLFFI